MSDYTIKKSTLFIPLLFGSYEKDFYLYQGLDRVGAVGDNLLKLLA